ncbi:MAG: hypothetical protein QOK39_2586 [Acidimicrobiaceae bacterium]|jgi:hypothetical protein|nr:hypothetical protein [Acidimicrobiaceae bacterium]
MARRLLLATGLLLVVGLLVRRTRHLRDETMKLVPSGDPWTPITENRPEPIPAWLAPVEGACPPTHLIKAKAASGIYHLPGMANYQRTKPDRCYAEESVAEADGFTKAKR